MTLPGGPAAKLGHRYEMWWTLSELVRMLRGETDSLRLEPPGEDDVEFIVKAGGAQEYHQAKRSHRSGKWSVATLASAGVLASMGKRLIGNRHRFVFVSGSDARELADLCEGAADAESFEEFGERFLRAEPRASSYERVLSKWGCDRRDAWDALRRVDVRTTSEHELKTKVRWGVASLFHGSADDFCARLAAIVDDAVHRTIVRDHLSKQLAKAGLPLRKVSSPHAARQAVFDTTERYLSGVRRNLIQGALIPRTKAAEVIGRLTGEKPSDCVLTGQAGSGKTGCMIDVVNKLRANGVQVLAFRLDRHMSATTTADLGRRLELEESPALVLNAAAKDAGAPAVLIIDQLDAVSAMSGRVSEAFDVVAQLLVESKAASVQTVVVCRAFDWHNDPRLRSLIREDNKEVDLDELSLDEVREVLTRADRDVGGFSTRQLGLLRLPQNLALFLGGNFPPTTGFSSASDLFGRYWNEKRRLVAERTRGGGDQWIDVIRKLCDEMNASQQLSVRKEKLDRFPPDLLDQYISEHVLVVDGDSYAFGHESFFDYCFARLFVNKETPLTALLTSSEQHLFRRSQVRQVLVYLREANFDRYVKELEGLVSHEGVRVHLKDLVFALLASFDDPQDDEWRIWAAYVQSHLYMIEQGQKQTDKRIECAWKRIFQASSWFKQFNHQGTIVRWLQGRESQIDLATNYLIRHQGQWPGEVVEYLERFFVGQGIDWSRRLQTVIFDHDSCRSRPYFDLFLRLLDRGTFATPSGGLQNGVWHVLQQMAIVRPKYVAEITAHVLRHCSAQMRQSDVVMDSPKKWRHILESEEGRHVSKTAKNHPHLFVRHVLPALIEMAEAAPKIEGGPPVRDVVWPYLFKGSHSFADTCLLALADALEDLASAGHDLREVMQMLAVKDIHVANYLLLAIYRAGGRSYAEDAIRAFCQQPWRFDCGYTESPYWFATETLKAVVPHCANSELGELERVVLAYASPHERARLGGRRKGWATFNLLAAIPENMHGRQAKLKFQELRRKFGEPERAPRGVYGIIQESPIGHDEIGMMNDDDLMRAIASHASEVDAFSLAGADRRRVNDNLDVVRGGAIELAQKLGEAAQAKPERFVRLLVRLPLETNPVYFSEMLRGLAETNVEEEDRAAVCRRVFEYARDACGGEIVQLLGKANAPLSDVALDVLVSLALELSDQEDGERWRGQSGHFNSSRDIYAGGINTVRGQAILMLGDLVLGDNAYVARLNDALGELVLVRDPTILSCVAHLLRAVSYHRTTYGVGLFLSMDFDEPLLLATPHVYAFLCGSVREEFLKMKDLIHRMLGCPHPEVVRVGARLVCMAAFFHDEAHELAEGACRASIHERLGSADVAAAWVAGPEGRQWCRKALRAFFADDELDVRVVAASCFRNLPEDELATYEDLMVAFCHSPAYQDSPFSLLNALKDTRGPLPPEVTCLACDRALDCMESGFNTWIASELIFRLYQQHPNDQWTKRCLDLIDRLWLESPDAAAASWLDDFER